MSEKAKVAFKGPSDAQIKVELVRQGKTVATKEGRGFVYVEG